MNKKIVINALIRWAGEIFSKIIWFIFLIFLARWLGDKNFGYFSYAISFSSLFVIFTDFGTNILLVREISRNKDRANLYITNVLLLKLLTSIVVFMIIYLLALILTEIPKIVIFFSLALLISAFLDPFNSLYRANKQMHFETIIMLLWRITLAGFSIVGVYFLNFDLLRISYVFIFASMIILFLTIFISIKNYGLKFLNVDISLWKELIINSVPLGIIILSGGVFYKLNTILLHHFCGAQQVGWYSASFRLIEGTFFIPSFFVASVFPFFCELDQHKESVSKLIDTFQKSFLILFSISICLVTFMFIFSEQIINLFYGKQFIQSIKSLKISVWSLIFIFFNELFLYFFVSVNRQTKVITLMSFSIIIYVILCLLLIPYKGFVGASLVLLISQTVLFILYLFLYKKYKYEKNFSNISCLCGTVH